MELTNPKELTVSSFRLYNNRLEAIGDPSFEEWKKCGEFLKNANGAVHFWIGDWLNYGEFKYKETYQNAVEETGYDYKTLSNDKWIASRIDKSRRRDGLSFSHHAEIADLTPEEQTELLDKAEAENMPREAFRKTVRDYKLKLDLPELTEQQLQGSTQDFDKVVNVVMQLVEVTDNLKAIDLTQLNPDAKDFLISQVKKTLGVLSKIYMREVNQPVE